MDLIPVEIVNIVASGRLKPEIYDLPTLALDLEKAMPHASVEHSRRRGNRLNIRSPEFEPLLILAPTGTYVITGATDVKELAEVEAHLFEGLKELGILRSSEPSGQTNEVPLEIRNVVAVADIGEQINLNALTLQLGLEKVEYEPETFPGLVYRPPEVSGVALIFASGKMVLTGLKDEAGAKAMSDTVYQRIRELL